MLYRRFPMLLDDFLPYSDVASRHAVHVRATPETVFEAMWRADIGGPIACALLATRLLPAALAGSGAARARLRDLRAGPAVTLRGLRGTGFTLLGEHPGEEVVLGITGRFWTAGGDVMTTDPARFAAGPPAGAAQAAWSFTVTPLADGGTRLATETRVRCADADSRRRFRVYWLVIGPFSSLLRRLMLRAIRREAERAVAAGVESRRRLTAGA